MLRPPPTRLALSAMRNTLVAQDWRPPHRGHRPRPCLRHGHGRRILGPAPFFLAASAAVRRLAALFRWTLHWPERPTGNPTGVGCARRAERPLVFAAAHTGSTPLGRRATRLGSAGRSAPTPRCRSARVPPRAAFGGRLAKRGRRPVLSQAETSDCGDTEARTGTPPVV